MRVALLHNPRPETAIPGAADDAYEEYDSPGTIAAIIDALCGLGIEVEAVEADRSMPARLEAGRYDFAFNIAEGKGRRCREAVAASVCELFDLPYTGSDALTLAVTLDKNVARRIVSPEVRVAPAVLINTEDDEEALDALRYPVVVKPNDEGSSKGIGPDSVADNPAGAIKVSRRLRTQYGCSVLVEEFLSGAEITVGIVGNGSGTHILGMMEIAPRSAYKRFVYSIDVKRDWRRQVDYHVPPRIPSGTSRCLEQNARTAYRLLGCRDFARIDFRLDDEGLPVFLECNALPGLDPENSDLVIMSRDPITYQRLVQTILLEAFKRTGVPIS
jgi:D-alanine-D-alanine ligase